MSKTKPFIISKQLVVEAYQRVKANAGAAGIDQQTVDDFNRNLKDNLYKIWNRMASGTYFPPAVRAVSIPKASGGERILGIPTVSDRIAQMIVKLTFEPLVEPYFLEDSYGYRSNKSALDAVGVVRQRCWKYDWVLEFDIKGLFDNIDHELLMKAVKKHTNNPWVILYIERWLKAPKQRQDGVMVERTCGVPQGGVISPILSNVFLHYVFDVWMRRHYPSAPWCRYADDGVIHCKTEMEAYYIRAHLEQRLIDCKLELHPEKTRIIYCKDQNRKKKYSNTKFTFLGYEFRRRSAKHQTGGIFFLSFLPAISQEAKKSIRTTLRGLKLRRRSDVSLEYIAQKLNPVLRGWINYYGRYTPSALNPVMRTVNKMLIAWAMHKYKRLKGRKTRAGGFIKRLKEKNPMLFEHWKRGTVIGVA